MLWPKGKRQVMLGQLLKWHKRWGSLVNILNKVSISTTNILLLIDLRCSTKEANGYRMWRPPYNQSHGSLGRAAIANRFSWNPEQAGQWNRKGVWILEDQLDTWKHFYVQDSLWKMQQNVHLFHRLWKYLGKVQHHELSAWTKIERGIRHGCVVSTTLPLLHWDDNATVWLGWVRNVSWREENKQHKVYRWCCADCGEWRRPADNGD